MVRVAASSALVLFALAGCGKDTSTDSGATTSGTAGGTPAGTAGGTTGGTPTGTATGTGSTTGSTPPIPDRANCSAYGEQVMTSNNDQYTRGIWQTYNALGQLVAQDQDLDADGVPEDNWVYTYDGDGNRVTEAHDADGDGTIDELTVLSYSANGNVASLSFDYDNDGVFDAVYVNTENADGNVVLQEGDTDNDGVYDSTYTWIYTGTQLTREEYDVGIDGILEQYLDYTYPGSYGGDYQYVWDTDGDTYTDTLGERAFDAMGNLTFDYLDQGMDGIVEQQFTFSYYPNGVLDSLFGTLFSVDLVIINGGFFDYYVENTYGPNGFITEVRELADVNRDGAAGGPMDVLWTETWTWSGCANSYP